MSPIHVNPDENLARYLFSRKHYSTAYQTVKYTAFIPPPANNRLSVFRISDLSGSEVWNIGENIGTQRGKTLFGRADIEAMSILETGLSINADDIPHRHANIIGWPEEASAIKLKAIELAEKAQLHLK
jgi:hypothetical protein